MIIKVGMKVGIKVIQAYQCSSVFMRSKRSKVETSAAPYLEGQGQPSSVAWDGAIPGGHRAWRHAKAVHEAPAHDAVGDFPGDLLKTPFVKGAHVGPGRNVGSLNLI